MHECTIDDGDVEVRHFFFVASEEYSIDICDCAFFTMYPDVMAFIKENYPKSHPQSKTSYASIVDKEDMNDREVPKSIIEEFYTRKNYSKYHDALEALQNIFEKLAETYTESWTVSSKGTVACNYAITPFGDKETSEAKSLAHIVNANHIIFKAVEHFITLQKIPVGEPIPEEINEFIEQYNALKLLEG
jgi:hypothetical protein